MMDNLIVKWNGGDEVKVKGIIAVRTVFGLGVRQAINLLKDTEGFVITPLQWIALRGEYILNRVDFTDRNVSDWIVETYKPIQPTWLVDHICRDTG